MNPPMVYEVTSPRPHSTRRMIAIVHNMMSQTFPLQDQHRNGSQTVRATVLRRGFRLPAIGPGFGVMFVS
jgi:hypothetical protein